MGLQLILPVEGHYAELQVQDSQVGEKGDGAEEGLSRGFIAALLPAVCSLTDQGEAPSLRGVVRDGAH